MEMTDRLKMTLPEDCQDASLAMVAAKNPQAFVIHVRISEALARRADARQKLAEQEDGE